MNAALVPVRSLASAKNRLAASLDLLRREELAVAMLADMVEALKAARSLQRVIVVSADPRMLAHAVELGAEALDEGEPRGLNAAVAWAALVLEGQGVTRLLTVPGDVPLLETTEIDRLLATDPYRHPVVLVPSASHTGTNGLLTSPPTVLTPCFEGESLAAHLAACRAAACAALVLPLASFALDVDTADDLAVLAEHGNARRSSGLAAAARPRVAAAPQRPLPAAR